ncbi:pyridoxal-phosphate dependent enzyme [Streptomyces sp. NPDC001492]
MWCGRRALHGPTDLYVSPSRAYDHPRIAAGTGTLLEEIRHHIPDPDTAVVAVGGGLFAGVATGAQHHGTRTVAVEPENCRARNAALQSGSVIDATVDSIAADSLGARRTSQMALPAARQDRVHSVLVPDIEIIRVRQALRDHRKVPVYGAATALAALTARRPAMHRPGPAVPADRPQSQLPARQRRAGLRGAVRVQPRRAGFS